MQRVILEPEAPDREAIRRVAAAIRTGGLVVLPTDTLYGLAVDAFNPDAVRRVFAAKGRAGERALPLIGSRLSQVERHLGPLSPTGRRLAMRFWPGPLTMIVAAPETLSGDVTGHSGTIAVRVPANRIACEVCEAAGTLLSATSANLSGSPATGDPDVVAASPLAAVIDLLVDGGRTPGGAPSTIVDISTADVRLVRAGAVPWEEIEPHIRFLQGGGSGPPSSG
jgi:L-threonylcarbamoyladenylate synthase